MKWFDTLPPSTQAGIVTLGWLVFLVVILVTMIAVESILGVK